MAAGVDTPESKLAEFRAHYLYSGNASESARSVGIPESTGRDIARRLVDDEEFAADRRQLRKAALDELVAMRMRVAAIAMDRLKDDLPIPQHVEKGAVVNIADKRADYGKLIIEAEKNAHRLAVIDEGDGAQPGKTEVHVHLKGVDVEPDDDQSG